MEVGVLESFGFNGALRFELQPNVGAFLKEMQFYGEP